MPLDQRTHDTTYGRTVAGLSAGRVQSAGLKLLVDRERERMLFRPAQYAGTSCVSGLDDDT